MGFYRKKPVIIEAIQWFKHGDHPEVLGPDNLNLFNFQKDLLNIRPEEPFGIIQTLEGPHIVRSGDWIIKGVNGEFYACKPDIFEKTYDSVYEEN